MGEEMGDNLMAQHDERLNLYTEVLFLFFFIE